VSEVRRDLLVVWEPSLLFVHAGFPFTIVGVAVMVFRCPATYYV